MKKRLQEILKEIVVEYDGVAKSDLQARANTLVLMQTALNNMNAYAQYEAQELQIMHLNKELACLGCEKGEE